jgi:hypothetical protein
MYIRVLVYLCMLVWGNYLVYVLDVWLGYRKGVRLK